MWFAYLHIVWFLFAGTLRTKSGGLVQSEEQQNEELIGISKQILDPTKAIHELTLAQHGSR